MPHHLAPVEREKRGAGAWRDLEKKEKKKKTGRDTTCANPECMNTKGTRDQVCLPYIEKPGLDYG